MRQSSSGTTIRARLISLVAITVAAIVIPGFVVWY
jgi:hypothetical protein